MLACASETLRSINFRCRCQPYSSRGRAVIVPPRYRHNSDLKEFAVKSGQGKDGAKKPMVKFPGLVKKLQAEAAKKAPKGDQGGSAFPYGSGMGKKKP